MGLEVVQPIWPKIAAGADTLHCNNAFTPASNELCCAAWQQGVLSGLTGKVLASFRPGLGFPANFFQQELQREELRQLQGHLIKKTPQNKFHRQQRKQNMVDNGQLAMGNEQ